MHNHISRLPLAALALASALCMAGIASAQVAGGTTTVGVTVIESTQLAMGWSAKKGLLGKTVYNETGLKVGKVEDLIISPDRSVSYIIVGAGGFVGIGRHDVAIPVSQIQDQSGKLVMAGATKDSIKSLPKFRQGRAGQPGEEGRRRHDGCQGQDRPEHRCGEGRHGSGRGQDLRHEKRHRSALEGIRGRCRCGHGPLAQVGREGDWLNSRCLAKQVFSLMKTDFS